MDDDFTELQQFLPTEERVQSPNDLCIKQAAERILKHSAGAIPMVCLTGEADMDAANYLVEDCLLHHVDDLFEDRDDIDPEGYIKLAPDEVDVVFISRLLKYNVDPASYFEKITIPEVWKNRLSANGIQTLCSMKIYQRILGSNSRSEPSSDEEPTNCKC